MFGKDTQQFKPLSGKTVLITGAARRIGRSLALTAAHAGASVIIHHGHSAKLAKQTQSDIKALGRQAFVLAADLSDPNQAAELIYRALAYGPIDAIVNNAAVFDPLSFQSTTMADWQKHINTNLTALISSQPGVCTGITWRMTQVRIVNILDWRALRPGSDHFSIHDHKSCPGCHDEKPCC